MLNIVIDHRASSGPSRLGDINKYRIVCLQPISKNKTVQYYICTKKIIHKIKFN
jgi:hypothetical protein